VRACAEIQGRFVWGVGGRGDEARIVAGVETGLLEARCEPCGACAAYCPTGALENRMSYDLGIADKKVRSMGRTCASKAGMDTTLSTTLTDCCAPGCASTCWKDRN
jgi:predicted molibdopterin-dependent oxidoreductase YjgC